MYWVDSWIEVNVAQFSQWSVFVENSWEPKIGVLFTCSIQHLSAVIACSGQVQLLGISLQLRPWEQITTLWIINYSYKHIYYKVAQTIKQLLLRKLLEHLLKS